MSKTQFDDSFVQLPRGSFMMGSDDLDAREREKPVHEVHIDYDVAMCKFLVTVEDYMLFAQATGAEVPVDRHENLGFDVPVRRVRFHDAKAYCAWKSEREGKTFRLPTEAEWEYACRAGTTNLYWSGRKAPKRGQANPWGLKNMHRGPREWCHDWYGPYVDGFAIDPVGYVDGDRYHSIGPGVL